MSSMIEEIKEGYEELLSFVREYNAFVEDRKKQREIKKLRFLALIETLQEDFPYWRKNIGVAVGKAREHLATPYISTTWIETQINAEFATIERFFKPESGFGVYGDINRKNVIDFNYLRSVVWSLCSCIEEAIPDVILLEKLVELLFKLRENDFESISLELETIDEKEVMKDKCLVARTALEDLMKEIIKREEGTPKQGFYSNIDIVKKMDVLDKEDRKVIAAHYSFTSKIVHGEKEDTQKDSLYAINGIYNHIDHVVDKYIEWKDDNSNKDVIQ